MKIKVSDLQKWLLITVYFLVCSVAAAYFVYSRIRFDTRIDDIILPLSLFLFFTLIQAVSFHCYKDFSESLPPMICLSVVKAVITFVIEMMFDHTNIYFGYFEAAVGSVLIISFMTSVTVAMIAELFILYRLWKTLG